MNTDLPYGDITQAVIGAAFEVHKTLGYGFLEAVYRNAMMVELRARGVSVQMEERIEVKYKGEPVGLYVADLVADKKVLVELKVAENYRKSDEAQLLNELAATGFPVGLLINFGRSKVEFKRMAWNLEESF
jgi:GxxExxY protein